MSASIKRVFILFMAFAMVIMFMPATAVHAAGKSKTKATVSTQKQLNKALKTKRIKTITISTTKKKSITIPKGNYKTKKIAVKGKKLAVVNKGKTGRITVFSAISFTQSGSSSMVSVDADDSNLVLKEGSETDTVKNTGEDVRILDNASTDIVSKDSATVIVGQGAENTSVDMSGNGTQSSVINTSDNSIDLDVDDTSNNLAPGDVYSGTGSGSTSTQIDKNNPFRNFSSMVKSGSLSLEIHGYGKFASMSSDTRIHGWYYNLTTNTHYECYFVIDGNNIVVERIENPVHEENYQGNATFELVGSDSSSMTIRSTCSNYGDEGTEYQFYYDCTSAEDEDSVDGTVDNQLKIFSGCVSSYPLTLEIHGCGMFSKMSHGNKVHGWYRNDSTDTAYECFYIVDGNKVKAACVENTNYNKNYKDDAEFEITDSSSTSVTMRSTNNVYGDVGTTYTFKTSSIEDSTGEVAPDNPLKIFSGSVEYGSLKMEIHGSGAHSYLSHGNKIHGWYYNSTTGTAYEAWLLVDGDSIQCSRIVNKGYEKKYLGDAEFKIIASDSTSVTLQSMNNVYGDEGATYKLTAKSSQDDTEEPVTSDNPLKLFSGYSRDGNLSLDIHGSGQFSYLSHGNRIHGWYYNYATNTEYEAWMSIDGDTLKCTHTVNISKYEKNYKGNAEFQIIAKDSISMTIKSMNNFYGDEGTTYTLMAADPSGIVNEPVAADNPLKKFSGRVEDGNVKMDIHGSGQDSSISHGNKIHGWYYNDATGTAYETWMLVAGDTIYCSCANNDAYNKNYIKNAVFKILANDSTSITLQSMNNAYGDEGTVYTFKAN